MISDVNALSIFFYKLAKINQPKAVRSLDEKLYKELFGKFTDVQEKERGVYAALAYARIKEGENVGIDEAVFDVNSLMATYRSVRSKLEEKDIFKYNSYQEFASKVNQVNLSMGVRNRSSKAKESSREKQEEAIENGSAVKVFEDDKNVIFRIDNSQAATAFGSDTSWCITKERGYLESYQSQNATFYFCINKELPQDDPYSKVAIRVIRDFDGNIYDVKFTKKTNDGDDNDISDLQNHENFVEVLKQDTLSLPPSLATKVKNKTASPEETEEFWERLLPSSIKEKGFVVSYLKINTKLSPKISFFVERESKTTQDLIDYLKDNPYDAAILEQLAKVSTDQKTLEKLYETKYWNVQKEVAKKTNSNKVIRDAANSDYNEVQAALASNPYVPAGYADYILDIFEYDGNVDGERYEELEKALNNRDYFDTLGPELSEHSEFIISNKVITDMVRNSIDGPTPKTNKILETISDYFDKDYDLKEIVSVSDMLADINKEKIIKDIVSIPDYDLAIEYAKINGDKYTNYLQEFVCKIPAKAYHFAKEVPGADIKYCQEHACKTDEGAYLFALDIPGADIAYCQKYACKSPRYAFLFAQEIPGANIKYCQEHACTDPFYALRFAMFVPGADIEYCQKYACKDPAAAYSFAKDVPGADATKIYQYLAENFGKENIFVQRFKKQLLSDESELSEKENRNFNIENRINEN